MEKDISSYLRNGIEFDTKVIKAVAANETRVAKAHAELKDEMRENFTRGHEVGDMYADALRYEDSQVVYTAPSKANGEWGNIHYNNPQKIMDGYVKAYKADQANGAAWREDFAEFGERVDKSHEILGDQVEQAWETNGIKAHEAAQDAFKNAGEAMRAQSLAGVDSAETREDARNFMNSVGNAAETVRTTFRIKGKMEQKPDDRIEEEFAQFVANREKISKGFGDAMKYEYENTHFDAGKKGGWGSLEWTNKQQIVDNYAKPMEANKLNNERFGAQLERFGKERAAIKKTMDAQAAKTWPPAFKKMETSWRKLTSDFDNKSASLVASEQVQKADLDAAWHAGADMNQAVIGDFLEFFNDTKTQRKAFGEEVKTYIENKKKINE